MSIINYLRLQNKKSAAVPADTALLSLPATNTPGVGRNFKTHTIQRKLIDISTEHVRGNVIKIPANQDEITLYCFVGEALWKIQIVEQALSHSITLKMNPAETKERADEFLKQHQSYTLGKAIKIAIKEKLYSSSLQDELNTLLEQRNWLVHKAMFESHNDLNTENKKEEFFHKIKSISDKAESVQHEIEYDMINFCSLRGKNMSKILSLLKLQDQGVRIQIP